MPDHSADPCSFSSVHTGAAASAAPDIDSSVSSAEVPRHLAIIMDGNNRWARLRDLPGKEGHKAGEQTVQAMVEQCARRGIDVLTLFAFSSENWRRPSDEVAALMALFLAALTRRVDELHHNQVRLRFIGDLQGFAPELRAGMQAAMQLTAANTGLVVAVAVNYGGQWDIAQAAQKLAAQVQAGERELASMTPEALAAEMMLADLPLPDLCIRTGGEQRLSNFMLWQLAYAELYFSEVLWPDFDATELDQALAWYASRQRRFGRTSEQIAREQSAGMQAGENE